MRTEEERIIWRKIIAVIDAAFAAGKRKPFAVASITAMIFFHIIVYL